MNISNLPVGTKLMWDASPNRYLSSKKLIIYPAIVGNHENHKNKEHLLKKGMALICFNNNSCQWMGLEQKYLRYPTDGELKKYKWPKL